MDPLSVAGSIIGILAAAGKVVEIVEPYVTSTKDAPKIAVSVHSEVNRVRTVLSSLHDILSNLSNSSISPTRAAFVQIDPLIVTFTDGVLIFSELESIVAPLMPPSPNQGLPLMQRFQWAAKKNTIANILDRLQRFLVSLSAILNIFQCGSDLAASQSQLSLETHIAKVLESNESLAARVRELEDAFDATRVLGRRLDQVREEAMAEEDENGEGEAQKNGNPTVVTGHRMTLSDSNIEVTENTIFPANFADSRASTLVPLSSVESLPVSHFESELDASRVYRKVRRPVSLNSFSSSAVGSRTWSVFSGLTLADISIISVIALPLCRNDIRNPQHYTFDSIYEESEPEKSESEISSSFYYECMKLRRKLSRVEEIEASLQKLSEQLGDDPYSPLLMLKWFPTASAMTLLYFVFAWKPNQGVDGSIPSFRDRKQAAYQFITACTGLWDIPPAECFSITDVYGSSYIGLQKVVQVLNRVVEIPWVISLESPSVGESAIGLIGDDQIPDLQIRICLRAERNYVKKLERLYKMKRVLEQRTPFLSDDIHSTFGNIASILNLHLEFLVRVETAKSDESVWSNTLYALRERFQECYLPYIGNHKRSLEIAAKSYLVIRSIRTLPPELKRIGESLSNFTATLASPVVHFFNYITSLKTLRTLHLSDEGCASINQALQALQSISKLANDTVFRAECHDVLEKLKKDVADWKGLQPEGFGDLLCFGDFNIMMRTKNYTDRTRKYGTYLFEMILIVCKNKTPPKRGVRHGTPVVQAAPTVRLIGRVFIHSITDSILLPKDQGQYSIRLTWRGDEGIEDTSIDFPNEKTARDWYAAISKQRSVIKEQIAAVKSDSWKPHGIVQYRPSPVPSSPDKTWI